MTNLPTSEQTGDLDNLAVTRAEFRTEIGILLEYIAQALGSVSGTYTTENVNPFNPELQGTPTLEIGAEPVADDSTLRIPTTQWVKKSGRYVGATAPDNPPDGMLWINNASVPYSLLAFNGASWDLISGVASGTRMLFQQDNAPNGWTKDVASDNIALRVTAGTVSTGGTMDFTQAFNSARVINGTVGNTSLSIAQMPAHSHPVSDPGHSHTYRRPNIRAGDPKGGTAYSDDSTYADSTDAKFTGIAIGNTGSGQTHTHTFAGNNFNIDVKYVDVIIGIKD